MATPSDNRLPVGRRFSALQRAEIAEMHTRQIAGNELRRFSALQRAEIAEIRCRCPPFRELPRVSVLFNEPKLLKLLNDS